MLSQRNQGIIFIIGGILMLFLLAFIPTSDPLNTFQKYSGKIVIILALIAIVFGIRKIFPPKKIKHAGLVQILIGLLFLLSQFLLYREDNSQSRPFTLFIIILALIFIVDGARKEIELYKKN